MAAPRVKLSVLGKTSVEVDGRPLEGDATHVLAALVALGLSAGRRFPRQDLADLLWPSVPAKKQAGRLRWLISKLRRLGAIVEAAGSDVVLSPGCVEVESAALLQELQSALPASRMRAADRIDAVLPGYAPKFSAPFRRWIDERRAALTDEVAGAVIPLVSQARQRGDWPTVAHLSRAIRRLAPLHEEATLALAEALSAQGDKQRGVALLNDYLESVGDGERSGDLRLQAEILRRRMSSPSDATADAAAPHFVGRHEQLELLQGALAEAAKGRGSAFCIAGPPGIGKTRLVEQLLAFAQTLAGTRVIQVACHAGDVARPLSGFLDLIPRLLRLPGAAGCDPQALEKLSGLSAPPAQSTTAPEVLPVHRDALAGVHDWLRMAVLDLLDAVAEEQVLLIHVDDFQWSHRRAEWIWDAVLQRTPTLRIVWCFGARATNLEGAAELFSAAARSVVVTEWLAPLDPPDARELADELLSRGNARPRAGLPEEMAERAGGTPLFVQELVRQWRRAGDVASIPTTLVALIDARLSQLSPQARRALEATAMLGTYAALDRIERLLELPQSQFLDAVAELERAGVLRSDSEGRMHGHALWGERLLDRLEPSAARALHGHIARDLEWEMARAPSPSLLWDIARHWGLAGQLREELTAITSGAEHLVRNRLFSEAADAYARAIGRTVDGAQKLAMLRRRADLLLYAAQYGLMLDAISEHESLAPALDPLYGRHNHMEMLRCLAHLNSLEPKGEHARVALACVSDPAASRSHRICAAYYAIQLAGRADEAAIADSAYRLLVGLEPQTDEDRRHRAVGEILYGDYVGDIRHALTIARRWADEEWAARHDPYWQAWSGRFRAHCESIAGDIAESRRWALDAARVAREAGLVVPMFAAYDQVLGLASDYDPPQVMRGLLGQVEADLARFKIDSPVLTQFIVPMHRARFAVEEGKGEEALRALPPSRLTDSFGPVPGAWARAIELAARQLPDAPPANGVDIHEIANQLGACLTRPLTWMDWPAAIYAEYLMAHRGAEAAREFVRQFMTHARRATTPPSRRLAPFVDARHEEPALARPRLVG